MNKVMKLIDPGMGEMECRVCGAIHLAQLKSGGKYYRGSWQPQQGGTLDSASIVGPNDSDKSDV